MQKEWDTQVGTNTLHEFRPKSATSTWDVIVDKKSFSDDVAQAKHVLHTNIY